jgi:dihydrofolate reductase
MRKIITTTFITLDGVMQAPGGSTEDTTDGFAYGGWQRALPSDDMLSSIIMGYMKTPFELLLGRVTYEIFAAYWPKAKTDFEIATPFNSTKKYVVSKEAFEPSWSNSVCITGDVVARINKLKEEDGPDLWVWGSGDLIQTLLEHDLIDRMHLWIHPVTIGSGKRLFANGTQPKQWRFVGSKVSTTGIIVATYEPMGMLKTGSVT